MNSVMDKMVSLIGLDIPFITEMVMRNGVGAFLEYGEIIAKITALSSADDIDYFEYGKVSANLYESILDYTVAG